jgi:D-ribulokinase
LQTAMPAMSTVAGRSEPAGDAARALHEARYQAFLKIQTLAREVRKNIEPLLPAASG